MKLTEKEIDGVTVLYPEGEADAYNCNQIKAAVGRLAEAGRLQVLINLSGLSYMDSSAIGVLVAGKTSLKKVGGDLKVCDPTKPVAKVFEVTRVGSFLEIYPDEARGLASFQD
jgi:anti-sigma B factor antagonist